MRPAGYNTSKYTKQDPNDHFGAACKHMAIVIGILGGLAALPIGIGLLVQNTNDCCFVMVMVIIFSVEGAAAIGLMLFGVYKYAQADVNLVYNIDAPAPAPCELDAGKWFQPHASKSKDPGLAESPWTKKSKNKPNTNLKISSLANDGLS